MLAPLSYTTFVYVKSREKRQGGRFFVPGGDPVDFQLYQRLSGARASRRPSPRKLKASMERNMARLGKRMRWG